MVYMGGKKKLAKFICPILQKELDNGNYESYIEPFVGGCNIIENINFNTKFGYDINKELIAFYNYLQNGGTMPLPNSFDSIHYNEVKKSYKEKDGKFDDWYYGYMMFVPSYQGKMWGSFAKDGARKYQREHYDSVIEQIPKIKDVKFLTSDYLDLKPKNSVIYCDIPYKSSKKNYYNENFNYDLFYDWVREYSKNNKIFVSELTAPNDFDFIWHKEYKSMISTVKVLDTVEKLFVLKD